MYEDRAYEPQSYAWEMFPAKGVSFTDLNRDRILGCIRLGVEGGRIPESALTAPIEDTLAKWKLTVNGVPTNGAAMLFSNNIYPYDNFQLRLARFLGTNKLEFIDNQRVEGNFFDLLDAGMAFFFKHLNLSGVITNKSLMREERLEVPVKALREALINALCHRQWEKQNLTISIAVYDDRVEIANPGVFPPQIPIENIKDSHESYPYNRNMAQALYRSTFLESWCSGIHRIIEACHEQGVEDPTWRWDGGFVYVTFKRPIKAHETAKESLGDNVALNPDNVAPNVALSTTNVALNVAQNKEDVAQSLNERILQIIKSNPSIRREDIAAQLSVNKKTVERHLKDLGIKWEGHSKNGYWRISK